MQRDKGKPAEVSNLTDLENCSAISRPRDTRKKHRWNGHDRRLEEMIRRDCCPALRFWKQSEKSNFDTKIVELPGLTV